MTVPEPMSAPARTSVRQWAPGQAYEVPTRMVPAMATLHAVTVLVGSRRLAVPAPLAGLW